MADLWGGGGRWLRQINGDRRQQRPRRSAARVAPISKSRSSDEIARKGQEQLPRPDGRARRGAWAAAVAAAGDNPISPRTIWIVGLIAAFGLWAFNSFYTVRPEEQSVELLFGKNFTGPPGGGGGNGGGAGGQKPGLNFAALALRHRRSRERDLGTDGGQRHQPPGRIRK